LDVFCKDLSNCDI